MAAPIARKLNSVSWRNLSLLPWFRTGTLRSTHRPYASSTDPPITPEFIPIPEWQQPENETVELKRARLLYQSRKRGMSENGLLLSTFAARYLPTLSETRLDEYDQLINKPENDWDIFHWITGHKPAPQEYQSELMELLKEHVANVNMEPRLTQPDLPENNIRQT